MATTQLSLTYSPEHAGAESWRSQLEAIRAAVNYLGLKEVAFALDVSGSLLCDAMNERDRKRWAAQWTHTLKAMLSAKRDGIASKLHRAIVEGDVAIGGYEIIEPTRAMTPDEVFAAYQRGELAWKGSQR